MRNGIVITRGGEFLSRAGKGRRDLQNHERREGERMELRFELPEGATKEVAKALKKFIWNSCGLMFDIVETEKDKENEKKKP